MVRTRVAAALVSLLLAPPTRADDGVSRQNLAYVAPQSAASSAKPPCPVVKKATVVGNSVSQAFPDGTSLPLYAAACMSYARGDFVVFFSATSSVRFIKKIAALPGDVVSFDHTGAMIVNGEPILQGAERRPYHPADRVAATSFAGVVPRGDFIAIHDLR